MSKEHKRKIGDNDMNKDDIEDIPTKHDKCINTELIMVEQSGRQCRKYPRPMTIIATRHESRALTVSSLSMSVSLLSSILYKERRIYTIQIMVVMLFSTLFWMKPKVGLRRTCDITLARFAVLTSIYSSFYSDLQKEFLINLFVCILSFIKAVYQWERYEDNWYLWHMVFHILGNTSNIILHHGRWLQRTRLLLN